MSQVPVRTLVICILISLTFQQLNVPLVYKKTDDSVQNKPQRHHLSTQHNTQYQHATTASRLNHNIAYVRTHLKKTQQNHQIHKAHMLNRQPQTGHQKIQTFNLKPTVYAFVLPMKIAGIDYQMGIDSGSSDMFIKGENSIGKPQKKYACGQTCIDKNDHYTIGYLDGRLKTYSTTLTVEIGDHKFNESLLVAYSVDKNFQENQGLIGLSFSQLATNPHHTFLQTLKNQKIIDVYAFGVNLNFQDQKRSFITFGSFDSNFFQGELNYFPLTSRLFYYVDSKGVSIGNGQVLKVKTALFDTGNTCISIPVQYQQKILNQFNKGQAGNKCFFDLQKHATMFSVLRCRVTNFDTLPTVNIHLGDKNYTIQKQFYIQACDRRPNDQNMSNSPTEGVWYCDTYIQTVESRDQLFLGDGFFNRYYTYFNLQKNQIGIAKNKEIIPLSKIIENQLDADAQDWKDILKKLNTSEKASNLKIQVSKIKQSKK